MARMPMDASDFELFAFSDIALLTKKGLKQQLNRTRNPRALLILTYFAIKPDSCMSCLC